MDPSRPLLPVLLAALCAAVVARGGDLGFTFNGFSAGFSSMNVSNRAWVTSQGVLELTQYRTPDSKGQAFFHNPIPFRNRTNGAVLSFSATFAFAIQFSGDGFAFVVAPTTDFSDSGKSEYLGLLNKFNDGNATNHLLFVEFDTFQNTEIGDIDNNHVGINVNGIRSNASAPAGYHDLAHGGKITNLSLTSGYPMLVWIDYDGSQMKLNVSLAPLNVSKPAVPLLSTPLNLSSVIEDQMVIGFSATNGGYQESRASSYILGLSFQVNGPAKPLNVSELPAVPSTISPSPSPDPSPARLGFTNNLQTGKSNRALAIWASVAAVAFLLVTLGGTLFLVIRRRRFKSEELVEDWEEEYGARRFAYRDLHHATKGFGDKEVVGVGGFGRVYKGYLRSLKTEVAVKKVVIHDPKHGGMKEFITEVVSISQIRHRNLVQLLGYCRCKGELLLVYDYMPNGSLDMHLFTGMISSSEDGTAPPPPPLTWKQRLHIVKGVASGLYYLHEECEKVVIHRDIKASNVLLDEDFNARLGDFGLARLYDHDATPKTTHVAGTMGYIALELARTGKATKATDVFAFGVFVLEVACGRRPIEPEMGVEKLVLVDWVLNSWERGEILEVVDPMLRASAGYSEEEVNMVLRLGLLCSHPLAASRPTMKQVLQLLDGDVPLPEMIPSELSKAASAVMALHWGAKDHNTDTSKAPASTITSYPSVFSTYITESSMESGR